MRLGSCIAIELALGASVALAGSLLGVWAVSEIADEFRREANAHPAVLESDSSSPGVSAARAAPARAVAAFEPVAQLPPVRADVGMFHGVSDDELLAPLRDDAIKEVKVNRGGSSISLRIEFEGGERAAFKPDQTNRQSIPRKEVAAFRINRMLGLSSVQPAIGRQFRLDDILSHLHPESRQFLPRLRAEMIRDDGWVKGALSWWIPVIEHAAVRDGRYRIDSTEGIVTWKRYLTVGELIPHQEIELVAQISNLVLFDFLINNPDRWSGGNARASEDGKILYFMDNTLSFGDKPNGLEKVRKYLFRSQKFSRRLVAAMRRLDERELRATLDRDRGPFEYLLTDAEIAATMARRDFAMAYIDDLIARFGESTVLEFP